jgi:two-component system response regulator FlrC
MQRSRFATSHVASPRDQGSTGASTYLDFIQRARGARRPDGEKVDLFLTADEKMRRVQDIVWQIADTNVPVLITGEAGTGKDVISQSIHRAAVQKDRPFITVNCSGSTPAILEAELFGYEKGAFPGANHTTAGKFELASGGTIVLDNITDMDLALQGKILKALQDKEFARVGMTQTSPLNARIIATSNRDILTLVSKGHFRQDLYYRLYVIHIEIPPLRERPKDIQLLSNYFVEKFSRENDRQVKLSDEALATLLDHNWPGNVRELQNLLQRAVITAQTDFLMAKDLPLHQAVQVSHLAEWISSLPIGQHLALVETHFILETLKAHSGNRTHAAKTLGISLRTLRNKINEFTAEGYQVTDPQSGRAHE